MRYSIILTFFLLAFCSSSVLFGQTKPSADSLAAAAVRSLTTNLGLTTAQQKSLLDNEKKFFDHMDSLSNSGLQGDKLSQALSRSMNDHRTQLKQMFTDDQWKKYTSLQETRRASFRKNAESQHATVNEVPVNQ